MDEPSPEYLAEDSSRNLIALVIPFTVVNISLACLRLIAQKLQGRRFGLDDFFSYLGLIFILAQCALGIIMVTLAGVGRHIEYLRIHDPEKAAAEYKVIYSVAVLYIPAFTFPKLSILCLYHRILRNKISLIINYTLIGITVGAGIAETLTAIFQCTPVRRAWDHSIDGHCVRQLTMYQFYSVPNIVTDVVMLFLPLPTIWRLNMTKVHKATLTVTFLLGNMGLAASIVRFVIFGRVSALADPTWASVTLQQWTIIEISMYFMAGILPTLKALATVSWRKMHVSMKSMFSQNPATDHSGYNTDRNAQSNAHDSKIGIPEHWVQLTDSQESQRDNHSLVDRASGDNVDEIVPNNQDEGGIMRTQQISVAWEPSEQHV